MTSTCYEVCFQSSYCVSICCDRNKKILVLAFVYLPYQSSNRTCLYSLIRYSALKRLKSILRLCLICLAKFGF